MRSNCPRRCRGCSPACGSRPCSPGSARCSPSGRARARASAICSTCRCHRCSIARAWACVVLLSVCAIALFVALGAAAAARAAMVSTPDRAGRPMIRNRPRAHGLAHADRRPRRRPRRSSLGACGEIKNTITPAPGAFDSINLMLDWSPNADQVGIYQAQADGDFRRSALNVRIEYDSDRSLGPAAAARGRAGPDGDHLRAGAAARPPVGACALVSVAALVQRPLTSIVSLGSEHITSVADLRGKTVGIAGIPYQRHSCTRSSPRPASPTTRSRSSNVGEKLVPAMLSHRVQATLGAYWNYEAIELAQLGKKPNVIQIEQAGVPAYNELVWPSPRTSSSTTRTSSGRSSRPSPAATPPRAGPAQAVANLIAANPARTQQQARARERPRDDAVLVPGRRQAVGMAERRRSGTRSVNG